MDEDFLRKKLTERIDSLSFRRLRMDAGVDFCSNDYLGIVHNGLIAVDHRGQRKLHGSTGSRLISGNYPLVEDTEAAIAAFHDATAGLLFGSGYDANLGLLAAVPQRGDTVVYDQLSHASLRDGIRLGLAGSLSFAHNDVEDLERKLKLATGRKFVVTESVFSMDGDMAPLTEIAAVCARHEAGLIVDEAHATGVVGAKGEGLVQQLGLEQACLARVHTFGKALGCHGAIVLGSETLKEYLVNFCRPFIYTTAIPAMAVLAIGAAYALFPSLVAERQRLEQLTGFFRGRAGQLEILDSTTPIQAIVIPGNEPVRQASDALQKQGLDVRPILYPTVPRGRERLRVVLHAFNTEEEVGRLLDALKQILS